MSGNDQYSQAAAKPQVPLNTKLADLRGFLNKHKTVLLTTRAPDGSLHARVMAIAEITPEWKFRFIYDNESYKETEVDHE
jgi:general stress protein 26